MNEFNSGGTPYQLRFDIFNVARSHLFDQYMINLEKGLVGPYPTFEMVEELANKIKKFVETR